MNRNEVMELARSKGLVVEPCNMESLIAVRQDRVPTGCTELMRLTSDGAMLIVADGYYWQVGTVDDVYEYVKTL